MKALRIIAILLLLFNSTGALFGGWSFNNDPTGADLKIPLTDLQHSPFRDFLIPGIVLFMVNGVFSLVAAVWTSFLWRNYYWMIIAQGILLGGWIVVQMILLQHFYYLQFVFRAIGMLLLGIGYILRTKAKAKYTLLNVC